MAHHGRYVNGLLVQVDPALRTSREPVDRFGLCTQGSKHFLRIPGEARPVERDTGRLLCPWGPTDRQGDKVHLNLCMNSKTAFPLDRKAQKKMAEKPRRRAVLIPVDDDDLQIDPNFARSAEPRHGDRAAKAMEDFVKRYEDSFIKGCAFV